MRELIILAHVPTDSVNDGFIPAAQRQRANSEIMVVAMIEDKEGVDNLDSILSVAGIDMVLEGAIDLSRSYGVPGQAQHPTVQDAIEKIATICVRRNVPFCAISRATHQGGPRTPATHRPICWGTTEG